jgi:hypothetical protein
MVYKYINYHFILKSFNIYVYLVHISSLLALPTFSLWINIPDFSIYNLSNLVFLLLLLLLSFTVLMKKKRGSLFSNFFLYRAQNKSSSTKTYHARISSWFLYSSSVCNTVIFRSIEYTIFSTIYTLNI